MIQRVQSVFLFLAALCISALFMLPVTVFNVRGMAIPMYLTGFKGEDAMYNSVAGSYWFPVFIILAAALMTLLLIALFSYKNRPRQIKLCTLSFFLGIILIGILFFAPDAIAKSLEPDPALRKSARMVSYQWICLLPVFSLIFIRLATRFIKKDEELVRSADRLR